MYICVVRSIGDDEPGELFVAEPPKDGAAEFSKAFGEHNVESNEEKNMESTEGALKERSCNDIRETVFEKEYCYCKYQKEKKIEITNFVIESKYAIENAGKHTVVAEFAKYFRIGCYVMVGT